MDCTLKLSTHCSPTLLGWVNEQIEKCNGWDGNPAIYGVLVAILMGHETLEE